MDHKVYLIQGFFWQYPSPLAQDTPHQIIREASKFMFMGALFLPASYGSDEKAGKMDDCFGYSVLSKVVIEPDRLTFVKKYRTGFTGKPIAYSFQRKEDIWIGEYKGSTAGTGTGPAKCILTEVSWDFFKDEVRSTCRGALS